MKKNITFVTILLITGLIFSNTVVADTSHKGHGQKEMPKVDASPKSHENMQMPATETFEHQMVDKQIRAEFQIMSLAKMNMKDAGGATHHIMVKLFHDSVNHQVKEAAGKVKVIGPDKKEQTNNLQNYNGIFAANFTFTEKGNYGVICLLKLKGEKHLFKFWYPHN